MGRKSLVAALIVALSMGLAASVYAASPIKLVFNGRELASDVQPQLVDGRVLVPLRLISESLGAKVTWDAPTNTVAVETAKPDGDAGDSARVARLEQALAPTDALTAAETWAAGVKARNGALQYAVMSPELKKEVYASFVESNWSTGVSSPWIEAYDVATVDNDTVSNNSVKYKVTFTFTDSTQATFTSTEFITVQKYDTHWFVTAIEQIGVRGEITRVFKDERDNITAVLIEGQDAEDTSYDKARASLDEKTKIYDRRSGKLLTANDLREGMLVEAIFSGPVLYSHPVQAGAKTITILEN